MCGITKFKYPLLYTGAVNSSTQFLVDIKLTLRNVTNRYLIWGTG
jgi:hypothetical protein